MKSLEQVNWGIIGCGDVTEIKSGPAFNRVENSRLVAVMRRDAQKAQDYAERHGVPKHYSGADELINDPDVNAIYVATPPDSHAQYTIRAAHAGKPVYVEKPMALTFVQCQQMIEACEQAEVPLFVAYYRRCLPNHLKIKEAIEAGAIGDVRFVTIQLYHPISPEEQETHTLPWRVFPDIAGGGHFVDLASHQLDYLDYLFGPIVAVQGVTQNQAGLYPAEDIVTASFRFESGVMGCGLWCFTVHSDSQRDTVEIVGSKGRISFSTFAHTVPVSIESGDGPRKTFNLPQAPHIQQPLIETVVEELCGRGTCPSVGRSAARTNWVMDQVLNNAGVHVSNSAQDGA
jgi:predicted dehydrogenase